MLNLVNWVGNVISPVGAALAVVMAVVSYSQGRGVARWAVTAAGLLVISGLTRLIEFWIAERYSGRAVGTRHRGVLEAMTLPQIIVDLLTLLFDLAVPAAICTMVLAGIALRQEGGVNFQTGGRFQRWVLWSVILSDAAPVPVVVCGAGYHDARTRRRHRQCVGRELADELERFCFERRGCQTDSCAGRFLRVEGSARCGRRAEPSGIRSSRDSFCCPCLGLSSSCRAGTAARSLPPRTC